jgi:endonuclease-3 related protein
MTMPEKLREIYGRLFSAYGPQGWWPGETPFEVAVGAILTQATNWRNAARAIANLKAARALSPEAMGRLPHTRLTELVRPAGFFNQKAKRLRAFLELIRKYGGLDKLFALPVEELREALLSVPGIGPETADSIVLYAVGKPVFVVDAYTRRILVRLGLIEGGETYEELRDLFESNLPRDPELYKEYHALFVRHGKEHCRVRPHCKGCPISELCDFEKDK